MQTTVYSVSAVLPVVKEYQAENNGVPSTIVFSELTPDTTYYIQVSLNLWDDIDFILSVKDSTSESAENTKVKAVAE